MANKKKNTFLRYLAVFRRNILRLSLKSIILWFKKNLKLKEHPLICSLIFLIWLGAILRKERFSSSDIVSVIRFHIWLFCFWLVLVIASNTLKEKKKIVWYLKRRFVFSMLVLFAPVGIILMWAGANIKKNTKIILTVIFSVVFILLYFNNANKPDKVNKISAVDRVIELITKPKKHIFLFTQDSSLKDGDLKSVSSRSHKKLAVSDIAGRFLPGVVSIRTKDKSDKDIGFGSGFVISPDGLIATNFHVLEGSYKAQVKIGDSIFNDVTFVKGVPGLDIAILKVDAKDLTALPIGDSDTILSGQFVIVLGNPGGLERSISTGIISALRSKESIKIIQITAPVSLGSSGGPVLNEYGEVVGIATLASVSMAQNLNFAIPINYLKDVLSKSKEK